MENLQEEFVSEMNQSEIRTEAGQSENCKYHVVGALEGELTIPVDEEWRSGYDTIIIMIITIFNPSKLQLLQGQC